jgi:hypothetical protein
MVPRINKTCAASTPYVFSKKVHAPAATLLSRDPPSITTCDEVWGVAAIDFEVALGVELGCAGEGRVHLRYDILTHILPWRFSSSRASTAF